MLLKTFLYNSYLFIYAISPFTELDPFSFTLFKSGFSNLNHNTRGGSRISELGRGGCRLARAENLSRLINYSL